MNDAYPTSGFVTCARHRAEHIGKANPDRLFSLGRKLPQFGIVS
jgi:hypothetical protein